MSHQDYILKLLGWEDKNIIFSDTITERKRKSIVYKVFHATLSYFSTGCPKCGNTNSKCIIKHGTKTSYIKLLPVSGFPCVLALRKQRFLFCDASNHRLLDIVENRQLCSLRNYFLRYSKKARTSVKAICIDLYSPYLSLIKELFPNASIVLNRFHMVQLLNRALIKTRIQGMKQFSTSSIAYKRLKRYWKLLLTPAAKLSYTKFSRWVHFKSFACSASVVEDTLSVDDTLKHTYQAYQIFLQDIEQKDAVALKKHLTYYFDISSDYMKTAIKTLLQHFNLVENSLRYEISNGCLEGINNYIKTLKKIAFGYRSFFHFKNRIFITKKLIVPLL